MDDIKKFDYTNSKYISRNLTTSYNVLLQRLTC